MFYEFEDKYEGGGFTAKGAARVSIERSEAAALDLDQRIPQFQRCAVRPSQFLGPQGPLVEPSISTRPPVHPFRPQQFFLSS